MNRKKILNSLLAVGTVIVLAGCNVPFNKRVNFDHRKSNKLEVTDNSSDSAAKTKIDSENKGGGSNVNEYNSDGHKNVSVSVKPVKFHNNIAPSRVPLQVITGGSSADFANIERLIVGNIANEGFEVTDENPFLSVSLDNGKITLINKMGRFSRYKAGVSVSVYRNASDYFTDNSSSRLTRKLLARAKLYAKGDSVIGKEEAIDSASSKLGTKTADWISSTYTREMQEVKGVKFTIDGTLIRWAFGGILNRSDSFQKCTSMLLKKIAEKQGILYCQLAGRGENGALILNVLYKTKQYPNGVFVDAGTIQSGYVFKTESERVDALLKAICR
ncbi:MAG: hypothetical protein GY756_05275 [bacterium]|nr:hypothetical protein [bacterium]